MSAGGPSSAVRTARALAVGALAGGAVLGFDQLLLVLAAGARVEIAARTVAVYAAVGGLAALVFELGARRRRGADPGVAWLAAGAAAAVCALAVCGRVHAGLAYRLPPFAAVLLAIVLGTAACGLWAAALARLAATPTLTLPLLLTAWTAAVGSAVDGNLVDRPQAPAAVAAYGGLMLAALALAVLARVAGAARALAAVAAIVLAAAGAVALRPGPPVPEPGSAGTRNLVLLVIDTLRLDVFRAVVEETAEGRAFRRAFTGAAWFSGAVAASPWTAPSMGSILTGLHPTEHGLGARSGEGRDRRLGSLSEAVPTLAGELGRRGYWTEGIVTGFHLSADTGIGRGFRRYEQVPEPVLKLPLMTALLRFGLLREPTYRPAASMRRRLEQRLPEIAARRPYFLWLHLADPHFPLHPHRDLSPDPAAAGLPELERAYRDEVRYALRELAAVVELLRELGLLESTVLAMVSDHGEMFPSDGHDSGVEREGEPMLYGHGHALYGELTRVPLVLRPPGGLPEDRTVDVLTSHTDLHDTFVDLLAVDVPRIGRDRVSLAPWLAADPPAVPPAPRRHALISHNLLGPPQRALRTGAFKLIDYAGGPAELFDPAADPGEEHDLAARQDPRLAEARRQLEDLWARLEAPADARELEIDPEVRERLEAVGYVD